MCAIAAEKCSRIDGGTSSATWRITWRAFTIRSMQLRACASSRLDVSGSAIG